MTGVVALAARLLRDRCGGPAVETALTLPILLSIVLGTIDLGRLAWAQAALNFAVQEAARCAEVKPASCGDSAGAAVVVKAKMAPLPTATGLTVTRTTTAACGVRVEATYDYSLIASKIFSPAPKITAQACRA